MIPDQRSLWNIRDFAILLIHLCVHPRNISQHLLCARPYPRPWEHSGEQGR